MNMLAKVERREGDIVATSGGALWDDLFAKYQTALDAEEEFDRQWWTPLHDELLRLEEALKGTGANLPAIRQNWAKKTDFDAVTSQFEALQDARCDLRDELMETPAPNRQALLWKLEVVLAPDTSESDPSAGITPWKSSFLAQTIVDMRRLLGRSNGYADAAIEAAWKRCTDRWNFMNTSPTLTDEEGRALCKEDAADETEIQLTRAKTPNGIAAKLWMLLTHIGSTDDQLAAAYRRDLDWLVQRERDLDWTARLAVSALCDLAAMDV